MDRQRLGGQVSALEVCRCAMSDNVGNIKVERCR